MKKLLFSLLSLFSLAVNAADFVVNGIAYNAISLTGLTCEVTRNSTPYTGDIVIPEKVSYQNRTFTVIGIGNEAFSKCRDVTSLILPKALTYIGNKAFIQCSKLTSLSVPGSVTSIGEGAMALSGIKNLRLEDGNSILQIEAYFEGKHSSSSFCYNNIDTLYLGRDLSGGDTKEGFFHTDPYSSYKNTLSEITIGRCVTFIPSHVFWGSNAKKIIIPSSVTKIYNDAFDETCYFKELIFEDGDTPIELGIHTQSTAANQKCVMGNYFLENLYIGRDIKLQVSTNYSYVHGFYNISNLKNVTIGETVSKLPAHLLRDCYGIKKIVLPKKLSNLNDALVGCTGIMDITCLSLTPPSITSSNFTNNQFLNATVKVAEGAYDTYKAHEVWGQFWGLTKAGSSDMEINKCSKPIITYLNGILSFTCETERATCQYTITDDDIKSGSSNEVKLDVTYHISVYATKAGYENSDVATATLCWIDVEPKTEGITNIVSNVRARGVLIQSNGNLLTISGADEGTAINVFDISGKPAGYAKASAETTTINTTLHSGDIGIVKIGEKAMKVLMK